jgi:uncharacterized protein
MREQVDLSGDRRDRDHRIAPPAAVSDTLATSRYTFRLPVRDGFALYNASTGAVLRLAGPDADELSALLSGPPTVVAADSLPQPLAARMRRNGFLVDPDEDQLAVIRERYWAARGNAPVVLLITTTMECNLGCYYCYESRSPDALRVTDTDHIVAIARERLGRQTKRSLHVDWYGGEPLLNVELIEAASTALQTFCATQRVDYHASVVSNGTLWPRDVGEFVKRHKLRQVQITFDGMKANHDKRRHYRPQHRPSTAASSFDRAVRLVDRLLQHTRVDLRFNADPGNASDFSAFLTLAQQRGWLDAPFRCVVMPARLQAFSERSEFMRRHELTNEQFEALEAEARRRLPPGAQDDQDVVAGFPFPMTSVCGALASDSAVIGADGLEYRCGLQVGERHRAVGASDRTTTARRSPTGRGGPASIRPNSRRARDARSCRCAGADAPSATWTKAGSTSIAKDATGAPTCRGSSPPVSASPLTPGSSTPTPTSSVIKPTRRAKAALTRGVTLHLKASAARRRAHRLRRRRAAARTAPADCTPDRIRAVRSRRTSATPTTQHPARPPACASSAPSPARPTPCRAPRRVVA